MFQNVDFVIQVWWGQQVKKPRSLNRSFVTIPTVGTHHATHTTGGHPGTHHIGQEEEGTRRKHGEEILLWVPQNKQSSTSIFRTGWFGLFQWAQEQRGLRRLPGTWAWKMGGRRREKGLEREQLYEVIPSRVLDWLVCIWKVGPLLSLKLARPWGTVSVQVRGALDTRASRTQKIQHS